MDTFVINGFRELISLVESFENALNAHYDLDDIPYNLAGQTFPREGEVDHSNKVFMYKFHGAGCRISCGDMSLDYGISPITENRIKITPRNFMLFIKSYQKDGYVQSLESKDFHEIFKALESREALKKRPESLANFEVVEKHFS